VSMAMESIKEEGMKHSMREEVLTSMGLRRMLGQRGQGG
jgi:hypothetical protein